MHACKRLKQPNLLKTYACSQSMEMFGIQRKDLIPEVEQIVGAATFLEIAAKAGVTLFI
jgi:peroxiredoxin family protein